MDILVCDSGMSNRHWQNVNRVGSENCDDYNGHGSSIIDVLRCIDNSLDIGCMKILDENKECSLQDLIDALYQCLYIDTKVILLALAIDDEIECEELYEVICKLYKQNKIIVSAVMNKKESSLPAAYPFVIGVKMNMTEQKCSYQKKRKIQCQLFPLAVVCEATDNSYHVFSGNSMLSTMIGGIVAKYCREFYKSINEVENYLERMEFQISNQKAYKVEKSDNFKDINCVLKKILENNHIDVESNILSQIESEEHLSNILYELKNASVFINQKSLFYLEYLETYESLLHYLNEQNSGS